MSLHSGVSVRKTHFPPGEAGIHRLSTMTFSNSFSNYPDSQVAVNTADLIGQVQLGTLLPAQETVKQLAGQAIKFSALAIKRSGQIAFALGVVAGEEWAASLGQETSSRIGAVLKAVGMALIGRFVMGWFAYFQEVFSCFGDDVVSVYKESTLEKLPGDALDVVQSAWTALYLEELAPELAMNFLGLAKQGRVEFEAKRLQAARDFYQTREVLAFAVKFRAQELLASTCAKLDELAS